MAPQTVDKQYANMVSVQHARSNVGKLLEQVDNRQRSLIIEKRGTPKAVLLSIRDYVKLVAPEPEVLRIIGEMSKQNGTDKMTSREIDEVIKEARVQRHLIG